MLSSAGHEARVVQYRIGPSDTYADLAERIASQAPGSDWIVVAHSGAGGLAASAVVRVAPPRCVVLVDAILPHPGRSWAQTAPPALVARLRSTTWDGQLAPWNRWFGDETLAGLVPDASQRAAILADMPQAPAPWLDELAPGEDLESAAYLQLSPGYDAEAAEAEQRGWSVRRLDLHHLAVVTHPAKVAAALTSDFLP